MPYIERHDFECPGDDPNTWKCPDDDAIIWRYMDLAKLLALLESNTLYFSRADLLGDPFENTIPKANWIALEADYKKCTSDDDVGVVARNYLIFEEIHKAARTTFVSCWHNNDHESAAMWKLYLKSDEGIAIRTTIGGLKRAFRNSKEKIYIGNVNYIDYEHCPILATSLLNFIIHKRLSFAHEREVRAVITYKDQFWQEPCEEPGFSVSVDLDCLIQKIYVAPSKQRWFADLVSSVVIRYGVKAEVIRSTLLDAPSELSEFAKRFQ